MKLVAATQNPGKLGELQALLHPLGIELLTPRDFAPLPAVDEHGHTFLDNARLKAHAVARHTGHCALADDSGLEVDALDGAPGVRSARFAADAGLAGGDPANVALLLRRLCEVPARGRTARFRCVLVAAAPDGREIAADGVCDGRIADAARGERGFGYDPVFIPAGEVRTFAELPPEEKAAISHRGRALANLRPQLLRFLAAN